MIDVVDHPIHLLVEFNHSSQNKDRTGHDEKQQ